MSKGKHDCKAAVVTCMDFRLHGDRMGDFLKKEGVYGESDMICVAGGVLSLSAPEIEQTRDFVLKLLSISRDLHKIDRIYLINHTDCGAYKRFGQIDKKSEMELHRSHLQMASDIIQEKITKGTDIKIKTFLADIEYPDDKLSINFIKL